MDDKADGKDYPASGQGDANLFEGVWFGDLPVAEQLKRIERFECSMNAIGEGGYNHIPLQHWVSK